MLFYHPYGALNLCKVAKYQTSAHCTMFTVLMHRVVPISSFTWLCKLLLNNYFITTAHTICVRPDNFFLTATMAKMFLKGIHL